MIKLTYCCPTHKVNRNFLTKWGSSGKTSSIIIQTQTDNGAIMKKTEWNYYNMSSFLHFFATTHHFLQPVMEQPCLTFLFQSRLPKEGCGTYVCICIYHDPTIYTWVWRVGGIRKESGYSNVWVGFTPWPLTSSREEKAQLSKNQEPQGRGIAEKWCVCCLWLLDSVENALRAKRKMISGKWSLTQNWWANFFLNHTNWIRGSSCVM